MLLLVHNVFRLQPNCLKIKRKSTTIHKPFSFKSIERGKSTIGAVGALAGYLLLTSFVAEVEEWPFGFGVYI